jgi:hypothetical protein
MSEKLTLSNRTTAILANFSKINPSMKLEAAVEDTSLETGFKQQIRTANANSSVLAIAEIEEKIPFSFPISDLSSFLGILKLPQFKDEDCILQMDEKKITLYGKKTKMNFWAAAESLVELPEGDLEFDPGDIVACISEEQFNSFDRACKLLGHEYCKLMNDGGKVYLVGTTKGVDTSNDFVLELGETDKPDAYIMLKTSYLLMMPGDYKIEASSEQKYAKFSTMDDKILYVIGGEIED